MHFCPMLFVTYESKLTSNTRYLHPRLTLRRMYQLYQESCVIADRKMLSESIFRKIFKNDFMLSFVNFSKPKCKVCNAKKKQPGRFVQSTLAFEQKEQQAKEHDDLLRKVQNDLFKTVDIAMELCEKTEVLTFELQHAIELPYLNTDHNGDLFFKKRLWCYCVCIFDEIRRMGYFYVWNESIASHGTQEIASCLYKHFINHISLETRKIVLFSDIHNGQNRNMKMSLMLNQYLALSKENVELESIEQHFFVRGHGINSCSRSFKKAELNLKPDKIFVADDLIKAFQKTKFNVVEMEANDFFSCNSLEELIVDYKKTQKVQWSDFHRFIYERNDGISFKAVRYDSDEEHTISTPITCTPEVYSMTKLKYLCPKGCPISKSKYDDLQILLENIPTEYHNFYQTLNHVSDDSINDFGLVSRISSDESCVEE